MNSKCILVIDDELLIRDLLYDFFSEKGWGVSIFDTGEKAFEILKQRQYDIALVDIKTTDVDGLAIVKRIKNLCPSLPVVVMTAFPSVETAVEALRMRIDDYIRKPFNINKLYKTLENIVELAQKQREAIEAAQVKI